MIAPNALRELFRFFSPRFGPAQAPIARSVNSPDARREATRSGRAASSTSRAVAA